MTRILAFKIKQRFFSSYEIAAPAANDAPSKGAPTNDELGSVRLFLLVTVCH